MNSDSQERRPESADQLLDLLLRSRWFADSIFNQLYNQSRDYLEFSALEFGQALIEKRCLSPWQISELLAGRNRFYRQEVRLLDEAGDAGRKLFVAEQCRTSRLVFIEISQTPGEPDILFEFETGTLLSQRIHNRQYDRAMLDHWKGQLEQILSTSDPKSRNLISPERLLIDARGSIRCLRPLGAPSVDSCSEKGRERAVDRLDQFFKLAEEQLESVLWAPASAPIQSFSRTRYQHLLRKGPAWASLNGALPQFTSLDQQGDLVPYVVADVDTTEEANDTGERFSEINSQLTPTAPASQKVKLRSSLRTRLVLILVAITSLLSGWYWFKSAAEKAKAGEDSAESRKPHRPADAASTN